MGDFNIYKDIAERTQGDIYLGVVGPVRTGKSTFIKKFMDLMDAYGPMGIVEYNETMKTMRHR